MRESSPGAVHWPLGRLCRGREVVNNRNTETGHKELKLESRLNSESILIALQTAALYIPTAQHPPNMLPLLI